ncbi:tetratricopeptide repeat protein [Alteraurantiacibacter aquimixticola]|uniref:SPOR domain-containing protein n=1 Tax=Alteraurantiacibacter aquimixticola TaxID=2489173 RepID=A0A4T3F3P7_9SPHN|nr:SPOR domain-containing protein [Alteraurantiacibacter aquimixticola]TIX51381.1 SPOR domain-containing protein [Alteraurantiacibacter aquimixticola]
MTSSSGIARRFGASLAAGAIAATSLATLPLALQAQEVVQPTANPAAERLADALRRLSRNPESLPALITAGRASLELNDMDAAEGFFARAQAVDGGNGAVLAGKALVALRQYDPVSALQLFERAGAAGEDLAGYAADHGLAFDLVGDNARAQQLYSQALSRSRNDEVLRRLALSQAISGDQAASEATLLPLLQRRDLAAYRTRAFALAILGREEEAVSIAEAMLPARLARRIGPYLRFMPELTPAQQAAAANLGRFPERAEIGRDDPQLARRMQLPANPAPTGGADERLIPGGEPLGPVSGSTELPALAEVEVETAPPASGVVPQEEAPGPSFSLSEPQPTVDLSPEPVEEPGLSLTDAFADFSLEDSAPASMSGAVDITSIDIPREEREPEPPPPPAHPSRHWVQVATGQDTSAFRFDWRRIVRNADGLLDDAEPYRARWNQTSRLLTGPFETAQEAQELVTELAATGINAFRFTSDEGEEVTALD